MNDIDRQPDLEAILDELYAVEPSLREHDDRLRAIVASLLDSRPDIVVDKAFAERLRRQLLETRSEAPLRSSYQSFIDMMTRKPLYLGGAALAVFVLALALTLYPDAPYVASPETAPAAKGRTIAALPPGGFGSLASAQPGDQGVAGIEPSPSTSFRADAGEEGGVVAVAEGPKTSGTPGFGGGGSADLSIAPGEPYPQWNPHTLDYPSESLPERDESSPVYRLVRGSTAMGALAARILGVDNGLIDLGKLSAFDVRNIQLAERGDDGFLVNLDLFDGRVYISQDWSKGYPDMGYDRILSDTDVPSDDRLITIAQQALERFGVDLSGYGVPRVDTRWKGYYELQRRMDASAQAYVPHDQSVTFPLLIEGREVRDFSGWPYGITVTVNVVTMKVTGIGNVTAERFERSDYALETDDARIIRIAERGGIWGAGWGGETSKTIRLGVPEIAYVQMHHLFPGQTISSEIYLPAYIFPLLDQPDDWTLNGTVVVPLVKDILDAYDLSPDATPPGTIDPPRIMPLIEPDAPTAPDAPVSSDAGGAE